MRRMKILLGNLWQILKDYDSKNGEKLRSMDLKVGFVLLEYLDIDALKCEV